MYQRSGTLTAKIDLTKTLQLLQALGKPHENLRVVHVAGTNGKGSVSHAVATMLTASGKSVGLYTSPHYVDYRERIRINGLKVPEQFVIDFVAFNESLIERVDASFFEFTVAMAFAYFASEKVDYAVIEVGMGGRLDSTNVVDPLLSVITNIGLDHVDVLGATLPEIALEKAGIIKPSRPVVIGEYQEETWSVFNAKANLERAPIFLSSDLIDLKESKSSVLVFDEDGPFQLDREAIDLRGPFGMVNLQTSLASFQVLAKADTSLYSLDNAAKSLSEMSNLSGYRGRYVILSQNPTVLADAGHNADAWRRIGAHVAGLSKGQLHVVCGFVQGKSPTPFFEAFPKNTMFYLGNMAIPRNRPTEETLKLLNRTFEPHQCESIAAAYESAQNKANEEDFIFVGGSTFVVGELFEHLNLG